LVCVSDRRRIASVRQIDRGRRVGLQKGALQKAREERGRIEKRARTLGRSSHLGQLVFEYRS